MKRTLFCILATALLLASCSNPFGKTAASSTELGSLSLSASSSSAKSILPATLTPASYTASGTSATGVTAAAQSSTDGSFTFSKLPTGSWTFTVEGLDSSNNVILSGTKAVTINVGVDSSATVTLAPASGTGTLSLSLSWTSAAGVSAVSATLTPSSGTANTIVFTVDSTNKMATYSGSLAAGGYELVVTAKNSAGTVVASSQMESVLIYNGQSSSATFTISDAQLIAGSAGIIANIPLEITVALSGNSSSLSHGSTMTVTATPSASVDSYAWYLDGAEQSGEASSSITFGSSLGLGSHRLMAAVKKNGIAFSNSCSFTVIPAVAVSTFAGTAGSSGTADGTGASARFNYSHGIVSDGVYLYVSDSGNNSIRKIVIGSGEVTTLAGSTSGASGSVDDTGASARFYSPLGIATDGINLYVADSYNRTIRKVVIASGVVTTLAGMAGSYGNVDGTGTAARFLLPFGLVCDGNNLYVADYSNHNIRKVVLATGVVTTLAGSTSGTSGYIDGTGTAALFKGPSGIDMDGLYLYVADYGNNCIRKVAIASGVVTTLAGSVSGASGSADGTGTAALFYGPVGIAMGGCDLYIADCNNDTIRRIAISSGVVSTLAGAAGSMKSTDGSGSDARFSIPFGIARSGTVLFVADSGNNTIRKITQE